MARKLTVLSGVGAAGSGSGSANYSVTFTAQTTVTVAGTSHALNTNNLIVAAYDNSTPAKSITPSQVTIDQVSFDVVVTFDVAQSGKLVINASGGAAVTTTTDTALTVEASANITLNPVAQTVRADSTPAPFTVTLPPMATWIGRDIVIVKVDGSANAVTWATQGGDSVDGVGSATLTGQWQNITIRATEAHKGEIIGSVIPAGVPAGVAAPNVLAATVTPTYTPFGHSTTFGFTGPITLPVSSPDYSHLKHIDVIAFGPTAINGVIITSLLAPYIPDGSDNIYFSGGAFLQTDAATSWDLVFKVYNEDGAPTPTPLAVTGTSVNAAAVSSLTTVESSDPRTADGNALQYTKADYQVTLAGAQYPQTVTLYLNRHDGLGWKWKKEFTCTGPSQVITPDPELVPGASETWTGAAVVGVPNLPSYIATLPAGAQVSIDFTVAPIGAVASSQITSIAFLNNGGGSPIDYASAHIGDYTWNFHSLSMVLPASNPDLWEIEITVQKGKLVSGTWTPAPDGEGVERRFMSVSSLIGGGSVQPLLGDTVVVNGPTVPVESVTTPDWTFPPAFATDLVTPNLYRTFRFGVYAVSRAPSGGELFTRTLQAGWASAASYGYLTPAIQPSALDLTQSNPSSLGGYFKKNATTGAVELGTTNLSNLVDNPGFEDTPSFRSWTKSGATLGTAAPFSGINYAILDASIVPAPYVEESVRHTCKAGQIYYADSEVKSVTGTTGTIILAVKYYDVAGGLLSTDSTTTHTDTTGAYVKVMKVWAVPVISGLYGFSIRVISSGQQTDGTHLWSVDNVYLRAQTSTSTGLDVDSNGNLIIRTDGATIDVNGSNNVFIPTGGVQTGNLAAGSLGDLSKYSSTVRAIAIVFGLPSLPSATYPQGAIIFNTSDSKLYRNTTGSAWSKGSDPADLIAGTIAAGVLYAGTVNAANVNAGTFTGFSFVGSTLVLNLNGITTTISSVFDSGVYVGLKCEENSTGNKSIVYPASFYTVNNASSASGDLSQGALSLNGAGGSAVILTPATTGGGTDSIFFGRLPSSSPGAGTKQLWYDAAAGNVVKYAV